ncbi:MAG: hypothetical protein HY554_17595 [Elusimicrobia bacterium]|nr:hypothetical protein [Elusimicrobiota bacterium]
MDQDRGARHDRPERRPTVSPPTLNIETRAPGRGAVRGVARPRTIQDRRELITDRDQVQAPTRGHDNKPIEAKPAERPNHTTIINNTTIVNDIDNGRKHETQRGRHYWHDHGHIRYSHWVDHHDRHWYGFYSGSTYYWTRWEHDRFWWMEPRSSRWCYWKDNHWWYHDPFDVRVVYVYADGFFHRYRETPTAIVIEREIQAPAPAPSIPAPAPAPEPEAKAVYSKDGTRLVQIVGDRKEAFLYDPAQPAADGGATFLAYLAAGVEEVRFSATEGGAPLEILLILADGTFALYDANGRPRDATGTQPAVEKVEAPAPPDSELPKEIPASLEQLRDGALDY